MRRHPILTFFIVSFLIFAGIGYYFFKNADTIVLGVVEKRLKKHGLVAPHLQMEKSSDGKVDIHRYRVDRAQIEVGPRPVVLMGVRFKINSFKDFVAEPGFMISDLEVDSLVNLIPNKATTGLVPQGFRGGTELDGLRAKSLRVNLPQLDLEGVTVNVVLNRSTEQFDRVSVVLKRGSLQLKLRTPAGSRLAGQDLVITADDRAGSDSEISVNYGPEHMALKMAHPLVMKLKGSEKLFLGLARMWRMDRMNVELEMQKFANYLYIRYRGELSQGDKTLNLGLRPGQWNYSAGLFINTGLLASQPVQDHLEVISLPSLFSIEQVLSWVGFFDNAPGGPSDSFKLKKSAMPGVFTEVTDSGRVLRSAPIKLAAKYQAVAAVAPPGREQRVLIGYDGKGGVQKLQDLPSGSQEVFLDPQTRTIYCAEPFGVLTASGCEIIPLPKLYFSIPKDQLAKGRESEFNIGRMGSDRWQWTENIKAAFMNPWPDDPNEVQIAPVTPANVAAGVDTKRQRILIPTFLTGSSGLQLPFYSYDLKTRAVSIVPRPAIGEAAIGTFTYDAKTDSYIGLTILPKKFLRLAAGNLAKTLDADGEKWREQFPAGSNQWLKLLNMNGKVFVRTKDYSPQLVQLTDSLLAGAKLKLSGSLSPVKSSGTRPRRR